MAFDKNQQAFPSGFHREVWWWAIGIVPLEVSLTADVRAQCNADVLAGCHQWHDYFNTLCGDMYANPDCYTPATARQYRDLLETIALGEIRDDSIVYDAGEWDKLAKKFDKSKPLASAGVTVEGRLRALTRTGLVYERGDGIISFTNMRYPKVFHAMAAMERSPNVRKTPVRHHFAHCEFRQLFKSYSANYDELLRRVSDEGLSVASALHDYAKSLKIQRYVHFDIIKYKYNDQRVFDFSVRGDAYPSLCVNVVTEAGKARIDAFIKNLGDIRNLITARKANIDRRIFIEDDNDKIIPGTTNT